MDEKKMKNYQLLRYPMIEIGFSVQRMWITYTALKSITYANFCLDYS